MIKRILLFSIDDWIHIWWLTRQMIKNFFLFKFDQSDEMWCWLKVHFKYDSKRIKQIKQYFDVMEDI